MKQLESIYKKYPEFLNQPYEVIDAGQNNMIIQFNHKVVMRCPRNELNHKELMKESHALSLLENHFTLKIPKVKYLNLEGALDELFMGYDFIEGESLHQSMLDVLDLKKIGESLSKFLYTLHQNKLKEGLKNYLDVEEPYVYWKHMYDKIKRQLMPMMREEKKIEVQEDFKAILAALGDKNFETTVIHGDFGLSNILIDKEHSKVTGIIDFGSIAIGDPAVDIASLIGPFGFSSAFIENYFVNYPDVENYLKRAVLYTKTFALQEALYGYENNDKRALDAGMRNYL
ncbi:MAG: aminoglycoside phosphotransferase family protein [Clostridia bacterium]|nr:aminoglycoside phosphotransferase family protein [Clostridia bacterium]